MPDVIDQQYDPAVPVSTLAPFPDNPRTHDDAAIGASIDALGFFGAVIAQRSTRRIVAGHGRWENAAAKGIATLPVLWVDVDDDRARQMMLADNRTADGSGYDPERLTRTLQALAATETWQGTGWGPADLQTLLADLAAPSPGDDDAPPAEPAGDENAERSRDDEADERTLRGIVVPDAGDALTRRGDVWTLGPHRIVCGDCRDADDVALAVAGATVALAVTSPPYADRRRYDETTAFRPVPPDEYVEWFAPAQENVAAHLAPDGSWVVNIKAGADGLDRDLYVADLLIAHVRRWGWHFADEFCWERTGVPKRPALRLKNQWEPVYQFARDRWKFRPEHVSHESDRAVTPLGPGAGNTAWDGTGDRPGQGMGGHMFRPEQLAKSRQSNSARQGDPEDDWFEAQYGVGRAYPGNRLPTFTGSHEAVGHSAAFPVGLPGFFVRLLTDEGEAVFDPFLGSGSSVLAAARNGRAGIGVELSPAYCDAAVMRLEALTGERAALNGQERPPFHVEREASQIPANNPA